MRRSGILLGLAVVFLTGFTLKGQEIFWKDSLRLCRIENFISPGHSLLQWKYIQQLEYSLSLSDFVQVNRPNTENSNQFSLLHNLKIQSVLERQEGITFSNQFNHTLGIQIIFDSITRFHCDENTVDTRLDLKIHRNFSSSLTSLLTTRFFNDYRYHVNDSGMLLKTLQSGFLTPLVWTLSAGFCWNWKGIINLNFGLSSARLTYVRDKRVYVEQETEIYRGVRKEKSTLFEYGFSLRLLIEKSFKEKIFWKCEVQLFKNTEKPIDVSVKSNLDIKLIRFVNTNIQTRLFFEPTQNRHLQIENMISFGFNFRL